MPCLPLLRAAAAASTFLMSAAVPSPAIAQPEAAPAADQASASTAEQLRTLIDSLRGPWAGVLEYENYGGGGRVEIPMRAALEPLRTELTMRRAVVFTDPDREIEAGELLRFVASDDPAGIGYELVSFPNQLPAVGEPVSVERWAIISLVVRDRDDWEMVLWQEGFDDNRPANLRTTQRMLDGKLSVRKDVDFTDDDAADDGASGDQASGDDAEWIFRNEVRLTRVAPKAETLLGSWTVDLRPTPQAEAYPITMTITSLDAGRGGGLSGTFYNGAPIENGRVNTAWGAVSFAFTTSDNSGVYFTSGTLVDGRLRGTTFSPARGFMAVWEGSVAD